MQNNLKQFFMAGFGDNKTSKKKLKKNLIEDNLKEQIFFIRIKNTKKVLNAFNLQIN